MSDAWDRASRNCALRKEAQGSYIFSKLKRLLAAPKQDEGEDRHRECGPADVKRPGAGSGLFHVWRLAFSDPTMDGVPPATACSLIFVHCNISYGSNIGRSISIQIVT